MKCTSAVTFKMHVDGKTHKAVSYIAEEVFATKTRTKKCILANCKGFISQHRKYVRVYRFCLFCSVN